MLEKILYTNNNKLDKNALINKERYLLLHKLTPIMMVANLLSGPILVSTMWDRISHPMLLAWVSTLIAACVITLSIYFYLKPLYQKVETTPNNLLIYYSLPLMFGLIWGAAGYFFFTPDSMLHTVYLVIFLFGFAAGAISALSAVWFSYIALAAPILLPYSFLQLLYGDLFIGIVFLIFLFILLVISKITNTFISQSIETRYENTNLLSDLKQQTEQANKANRDKSRFLAAASHDLRQPIHSLSLLRTAINPEVKTERGKQILTQIGNANEAMLNLLNSLLDISKLDAEIIKPEIQAVSLDELVNGLFSEFLPIAEENSLELKRRPCNYYVKTDHILLATIVRNLLQNAIRYTPSGKVLVACRKRQGKVLLQVWDTGNGIAEEYQELIFAEFQQLQNPERDQNKGLGLGLAICQRLSKLLNSPLSVASIVSKGSVFSIELDSLSAAEIEEYKINKKMTKPISIPTQSNFSGKTILVIDDNKTVLDAMKSLLESWNCTVITADSVEKTEAIANNHQGKIDAIIADYRLRQNTVGTDAIKVFNHIVQYPAAAMLITGDTAPDRMQEVTSHGLPVLHKPIKGPQLKIALGRLLRLSS